MCDLYSRNSMGNFIIAEVLPKQLFVEEDLTVAQIGK